MAAYTWTTFPASGSSNFETTARNALETWRSNADDMESKLGSIADGTIDAANVTIPSGKTLNVSAGTLTLADDQISGDKIEGGTINAVTVNTLTSTTVNATTLDTNVAAAGVTLSGTTLSADGTDANIDINIIPKGTGEINLTKVDIDSGTIDGTDITVGSGKTLDVSAGTLTLANDQISGDKIHGGTISAFASTGIDDNATATAITIDSAGNVEIGNTGDTTYKLNVTGKIKAINEIISTAANDFNAFRAAYSAGYGFLIRMDSTNSYFMLSNNGDPYGSFNSLRPFVVSNSTGYVTIGNGLTVSNGFAVNSGNTGLGVLSPVNKLDVEGAVAIGAAYSGTSTAPTNGLIVEGNVGIGVATVTAALHLKACTAAANTASLKINAGTVATTPVSGNIESDGTHLWWTNSSGIRKQLDN